MAKEIERKYLLKETEFLRDLKGEHIIQAYLSSDPNATVRLRIVDTIAFITVKGKTTGISRSEYEYRIPLGDAKEMLALCQSGMIEKQRYRIAYADHIWEVDVFAGNNNGLCVAEVELRHEKDEPQLPPWIGQEVSGDPRFYNSSLAQKPFYMWKKFMPKP